MLHTSTIQISFSVYSICLIRKNWTDFLLQQVLGQHRINGRIHIGGHAFCENQQDALCICSQGRTDSSCQAGPVSQNQIR